MVGSRVKKMFMSQLLAQPLNSANTRGGGHSLRTKHIKTLRDPETGNL